MAVYERAKKNLAGTNHYCIAIIGSTNCIWRWNCCCSIHLYTILKEIKMKADTSKYTILVISMGFLLLDILFSMPWARTISFITGIIGIISDSFSRAVEKGWMAVSRLLSFIVPSILLGSVFYLLLFPIAIVSKIFTKDPLKLQNEYQTLFIPVRKDIDKKSFEKTW